MSRGSDRRRLIRLDAGAAAGPPTAVDLLAIEEPLEIRIGGKPLAITMRTPGDDFDLVAGFVWGEGLVDKPEQIRQMRYCGRSGAGPTYNVIDVTLASEAPKIDVRLERNFYTSSSCGMCGKTSIDAITTRARFPLKAGSPAIAPEVIAALPDLLRQRQRVFDSTGGLHAAGLFTAAGEVLCVREDVGRHNAVDKVVGHALRQGWLPADELLLMVSGRVSFELAQKAIMAAIPVIAAVSAPSTLAVDLAGSAGLTLVGFVRGTTMNVYTGGERIARHDRAMTAMGATR